MRKCALILIMFLTITTNVAAGNRQHEEMTDLAAMVMDNNMTIDEWQVTIKEEMSIKQVKQLLQNFRKKNSYLVTGAEDENTIKYTIGYAHKMNEISENYKVVIPKNKAYAAQFIAVLSGNYWNGMVEKTYFNRLEAMQNTFFGKNSIKFTCLSTTFSDKINNDSFFNNTKASLNLKYVRSQTDTLEESMISEIKYGYTPLWKQKLTMGDKPMNFQMAITKTQNGNTKMTIGTPILITEY